MLLHVSALGCGEVLSEIICVFFNLSVTVESILSTVAWSWSSWHWISNSNAPIFILTCIGGFGSFCVKFFTLLHIVLRILHMRNI